MSGATSVRASGRPKSWKLPVGLSLSTEFGFVKDGFDEGQWSMEFRPIIDKKIGGSTGRINPTLDWWFKGPQAGTGVKGVSVSPEREDLVGLHRQDHRRIRVLRHDGIADRDGADGRSSSTCCIRRST